MSKFTPINKLPKKEWTKDTDSDAAPAISSPRPLKRARTMPGPAAFAYDLKKRRAEQTSLHSHGQYGRRTGASGKPGTHSHKPCPTNPIPAFEDQILTSYYPVYKSISQVSEPKALGSVCSSSTMSKLDAYRYRNNDPSIEQVSVLAPNTSIATLRSSPGIGCSVYDTKFETAKPSPSIGYKINRVISRMLSPDTDPKTPESKYASEHKIALVTDLESVNAVDKTPSAIGPQVSSLDSIMARLSADATDDMSDFRDEHYEEWYLGVVAGNVENFCLAEAVGQKPGTVRSDDYEYSEDDSFVLDEEDAVELELAILNSSMRNTESQTQTNELEPGIAQRHDVMGHDSDIVDEDEAEDLERLTRWIEIQSKKVTTKTDLAQHETADCDRLAPLTSGNFSSQSGSARKPITRKFSPHQVRDRSPVIGLRANRVLRTCFRVGEALNTGCQAARVGLPIVVELYARVKSSWRGEGTDKQHFIFSDLYHNRPPFMTAVHESWKGIPEWEQQTARFLDDEENEKMCIVIGSMNKRNDEKWEMIVQNIREASWADVEYVAGIYT